MVLDILVLIWRMVVKRSASWIMQQVVSQWKMGLISSINARYFMWPLDFALGLFFSALIALSIYKKRWYIRYHYILRKEIRREEPFIFDAFISYSQKNEDWVNSKLIPYLEDVEPRMKICFHERDFQVKTYPTNNHISAKHAGWKISCREHS